MVGVDGFGEAAGVDKAAEDGVPGESVFGWEVVEEEEGLSEEVEGDVGGEEL